MTASAPQAVEEDVSAAVKAFDDWMETSLRPYVEASGKVGGLVQEQVSSASFISLSRVLFALTPCISPVLKESQSIHALAAGFSRQLPLCRSAILHPPRLAMCQTR
jgi:hypothetical protein